MAQELSHRIASALNLAVSRVAAAVDLLESGNTLPFIARYRKEATAGLDEEELRAIAELLETLRALDDRRATILASIDEQGALTPELESRIAAAATRTELEDLYQPYRPKRRTRAMIARERGLAPLAETILSQPRGRITPTDAARPYLSPDVPTVEDALAGARDILAEQISDHADIRRMTREKALQWGAVSAGKVKDADDPKGVYRLYYEFDLRVDRLRPHQILALNRGEAQKILRVRLQVPERDWRGAIGRYFQPASASPLAEQLQLAIDDAANRLLLPAIERDVRRTLTETAELQAIRVFGDNLRGLLTQPPLAGQTILALDPGYRTGCKVAVVDPLGALLTTTTVFPHPPQKRRREAAAEIAQLIRRHGVTLIAVGNGTASRETEQLVADVIRDLPEPPGGPLHYLMVNEAGASVYSASTLARSEFPDLDVSMRSAVSIGRRVQDPLAELVKIDPKSIGVGMYQHDVDQKELARTLDGVVESVVNHVGVNVNTASPALLTYVAGIGPKLAANIAETRAQQGPFSGRRQLLDVPGLGRKSFEQSAGFLRVRDGADPLDASAIHPESYKAARAILKLAKVEFSDPPAARAQALDALTARVSRAELAETVGVGELTLADILEQLVRPGRDPREDLPAPVLRSDVLSMEDLYPGLALQGTVRNVVDFGAFVDIGVKQDGLLHRSQIPRGTQLTVGDVIDVEILKVEIERGRIGLGWASASPSVDWVIGD